VTPNRSRAALVIAALLWVSVIAGTIIKLHGEEVGGGPLEAVPLPRTECPGLMIGVHSTLVFEGDPDRRSAIVGAIHDTLGAQVVRDSLLWNEIEPVEGERDWTRPDRVVEDIRAEGMEPLFVVLGSPSWANGVPESTPDQDLYVPARGPALDTWLRNYSDFLAVAVERYKDFVRRWEIWNEPNLTVFWRPQPDPAAYRKVYETLRRTILRVDPSASVAVGGLTTLTQTSAPDYPGRAFLRHLIRTQIPLDNVAVHLYTTDGHPPGVHIEGENNFDDVERVHRQLVARGERASIWVTEWGWSSAMVGESLQAQYVDASLSMLPSRYPFVRLATYFVDHDRPPDLFYGLLDDDLEPKPAAFAFRQHADLAASRCDRSRLRGL
jgi:hypothetical protein